MLNLENQNEFFSDIGPEFANHIFSSVLRKYSIAETKSSSNHLQINGAVERLNRTLNKMLQCNGEENEELGLFQTKVVLDYNHLPHSAIGLSPSDFMLRMHITLMHEYFCAALY